MNQPDKEPSLADELPEGTAFTMHGDSTYTEYYIVIRTGVLGILAQEYKRANTTSPFAKNRDRVLMPWTSGPFYLMT
ncbi:hypothetical protein ACFWY5_29815 [Nonomuraea sp. NPDC059007]|uniref:hypothetical protein n=1 Tax=Nonomuraea sp. NPDC059007 TaxID=3346692 RepID=UPI0036B3AF9B